MAPRSTYCSARCVDTLTTERRLQVAAGVWMAPGTWSSCGHAGFDRSDPPEQEK